MPMDKATRVVLDSLLPAAAEGGFGPGLVEAGFDSFQADFERTALPSLRLGFRAAVWTAAWIAPLLIRRLPPLARHDRPTREQALAALGGSRAYWLRQMASLLKMVAGFCYGARPEVRAAVGYRRGKEAP